MPKVKILKLVSGEEILAMYIKSKLFTVVIEDAMTIESTGTLVEPNMSLDKFTLYGSGRLELKKSSIMSIMDPVAEMVNYYQTMIEWVKVHYDPDLIDGLKTEQKHVAEVVGIPKDATPEEMVSAMTPEFKQMIYTHILESFEIPKGGLPN